MKTALVCLVAACAAVSCSFLSGQSAREAKDAYHWGNVQIVAGGYVSGVYFHPTAPGLMYVRTDMGGAYRWGPKDREWVQLLDWLSPANWWYLGVEAIGLDPTDPNRLYLAVGEYAAEDWDSNGAMLVSDDQGKTFTTVPLPFKNGSNDNGRNSGERIAVDPNSPNIVYFGTRLAGLQVSTDHGLTWKQATGLPVTKTANGNGVVSVVPVAASGKQGAATRAVYAAVAGTGAGGDPAGLYVTTDGGTAGSAWTPVAGQPSFARVAKSLAPLHAILGPNGDLYVLYADQAGPNGITASQLWKFTPSSSYTTGKWIQIRIPANSAGNTSESGYGGIAADPNHAGWLLLATIDQWSPGDTIYRSTNDGKTWKDVSAVGGTHSAAGAPYVGSFHPEAPVGSGNWVGSIAIDPFNSEHVMYGTGAVLWTTSNLSAADGGGVVPWAVGAQGIEETSVGFALAPATGGTMLLSSMGDIYGFAHPTLTESPAQGFYQNPRATASGMDFEADSPATVVRVSEGSAPYGVISKDGGLSWKAFEANPKGMAKGGGSIAIAADGSSMVWAPADTGAVWFSANAGGTWTAATGIPAQAVVASDRVKTGLYYGYFGSTLYVSTNGGAAWTVAQTGIPSGGKLGVLPDSSGHLMLAGRAGGLWQAAGNTAVPVLAANATVKSANCIGFGKAVATGTRAVSGPLTLFLYGMVAGDSATTAELYRSTDGGATWTQINDAAHQWGGVVNNVTGDMRTFGTVYVETNGRGILWGQTK
jgi:hypothetical protein